jgi:C4-type Zn-finger protein
VRHIVPSDAELRSIIIEETVMDIIENEYAEGRAFTLEELVERVNERIAMLLEEVGGE